MQRITELLEREWQDSPELLQPDPSLLSALGGDNSHMFPQNNELFTEEKEGEEGQPKKPKQHYARYNTNTT